jgi:hypothetical protein
MSLARERVRERKARRDSNDGEEGMAGRQITEGKLSSWCGAEIGGFEDMAEVAVLVVADVGSAEGT